MYDVTSETNWRVHRWRCNEKCITDCVIIHLPWQTILENVEYLVSQCFLICAKYFLWSVSKIAQQNIECAKSHKNYLLIYEINSFHCGQHHSYEYFVITALLTGKIGRINQ